MNEKPNKPIVVLISADAEWKVAKKHFLSPPLAQTPFGDCFAIEISDTRVLLMKGGWGKVSAAASTQYAIDHFSPKLIINLGTCGGFAGYALQGEIIMATQTVIHDIVEQMTNAEEAIQHYETKLDLSYWRKPYPLDVRLCPLVSADHDIFPAEIEMLASKYQAVAADWESGAIAWISAKNRVPCLILRAVSDVVEVKGSETYGDYALFERRCSELMGKMLDSLVGWMKPFN